MISLSLLWVLRRWRPVQFGTVDRVECQRVLLLFWEVRSWWCQQRNGKEASRVRCLWLLRTCICVGVEIRILSENAVKSSSWACSLPPLHVSKLRARTLSFIHLQHMRPHGDPDTIQRKSEFVKCALALQLPVIEEEETANQFFEVMRCWVARMLLVPCRTRVVWLIARKASVWCVRQPGVWMTRRRRGRGRTFWHPRYTRLALTSAYIDPALMKLKLCWCNTVIQPYGRNSHLHTPEQQ